MAPRIHPLPRLLAAILLILAGTMACQNPGLSPNLARPWTPDVFRTYLDQGPVGRNLPDFSRAGYRMGAPPGRTEPGPVFDVTGFGAVPDDGRDDTLAIQAAVDAAARASGGVVFLPRGRYQVHSTQDSPYLTIASDHIVLRGQGSGDKGSVLFMGAPGKEGPIRRLGLVSGKMEARSHAAVVVMGSHERLPLAAVTQDVHRGQTDIKVSATQGLAQGQFVVIQCTDPLIDPQHPSPDKAEISVQLISPFKLKPAHEDTFGQAARELTWIAGIEKILDDHTVRLTRPARFDQPLRFSPKIWSFNGIREIGIEHLRIESAWPGNYRHHKPHKDETGTVVRSAKEQDYLWGGIWISDSVNGWVKDVAFHNMTQGVILSASSQWTIEDLFFTGHGGHAGVTLGWANDNLVRQASFMARMVHPLTLTMTASGNVISDCQTLYEGRDPVSFTDTAMDFHGMFPYENLFEQMKGFYVCPGGDTSVMPHAGVRNVFWNIEAPDLIQGYGDQDPDSFVQTYDYGSTSSQTPATMHEHFPQSFYIGVYRRGQRQVTLAGSTQDRQDRWMTVEGLNRPGLTLPSLYEAQKNSHPAGNRP